MVVYTRVFKIIMILLLELVPLQRSLLINPKKRGKVRPRSLFTKWLFNLKRVNIHKLEGKGIVLFSLM